MCTCRGEAFAKAYEESALKRSNDEELEAVLQQRSSLNKDTLKELSVTQATVTPFWWALFIMIKVRCRPPSYIPIDACLWSPCSQAGSTGPELGAVDNVLCGLSCTLRAP